MFLRVNMAELWLTLRRPQPPQQVAGAKRLGQGDRILVSLTKYG